MKDFRNIIPSVHLEASNLFECKAKKAKCLQFQKGKIRNNNLKLLFSPQNRTLHTDLACSAHSKQLLMPLPNVPTKPLPPCLQKRVFTSCATEIPLKILILVLSSPVSCKRAFLLHHHLSCCLQLMEIHLPAVCPNKTLLFPTQIPKFQSLT